MATAQHNQTIQRQNPSKAPLMLPQTEGCIRRQRRATTTSSGAIHAEGGRHTSRFQAWRKRWVARTTTDKMNQGHILIPMAEGQGRMGPQSKPRPELAGKDIWQQYPRANASRQSHLRGVRTVFPGVLAGTCTRRKGQGHAGLWGEARLLANLVKRHRPSRRKDLIPRSRPSKTKVELHSGYGMPNETMVGKRRPGLCIARAAAAR